jgi:hypothetical protein
VPADGLSWVELAVIRSVAMVPVSLVSTDGFQGSFHGPPCTSVVWCAHSGPWSSASLRALLRTGSVAFWPLQSC